MLQKQIAAGALTKKQQALLAEAYLADDEQGKKVKEGIIQELKGKMARDKHELTYQTSVKLKELNERRAQLLDREEEILVRRATIEKLEERGYDFLAEIELGNAPPMEYLAKNLGLDKQQIVQEGCARKQAGVNDMLKVCEELLAQPNTRLDDLRQQIALSEQEYLVETQYVPPDVPLDPRSKKVAEDILNRVFNLAFEKIVRYEKNIEDFRARAKYLSSLSGKRSKRLNETYVQRAIYEYPFA